MSDFLVLECEHSLLDVALRADEFGADAFPIFPRCFFEDATAVARDVFTDSEAPGLSQ